MSLAPVTILAGRTVEFSKRLTAAGGVGTRYLQARESLDGAVRVVQQGGCDVYARERAVARLLDAIGRVDTAAAEMASALVETRRAGARYV